MKPLYVTALLGLLILISINSPAQTNPLQCGVDDRHLPDSTVRLMSQLPQLMATQRARKAAGERRVCRVAVEIDSDTYLEFEKDTNRIRTYVLNQIEPVSKIYEREINTQLVVVYIHIWKDTEPDPYRGELNIFTLHSRFRTVWGNQFKQIAADKRIYLPTKAIYGAGGLGDLGGGYATAVVTTHIIAHELGHNFGSPHTHSCSWAGGPIDYCSTTEGDCYKESLESITGTVMSYCGTTVETFHPLCQTLMTDHAIKNFATLTTPDKAPVLPTQLTLSGTPFLYWDGQIMAERYDLDIATDAGFTQKIISDTTQINGYNVAKLTPGQTYYVRVRAVNKFGVSAWSGVCQLQVALAGSMPAPLLLSPVANQPQVPFANGSRQYTVQPVTGATSYEIQLTSVYDELFKSPYAKATSTVSSFTVSSSTTGLVRWRVRAIFGSQNGPWSAIGRFFVNQQPGYFYKPFYDTAPLTFPYAYYQAVPGSTVQVQVAVDSLFSKPVYTHTFASREGNFLIGTINQLAPNTQYYVKIEETTTQDNSNPTGVLSRFVQSFKTNSMTLSSRWSLINSATYPEWPQGWAYGTIELGNDAVWFNNANGPTRISQDSLTLRVFNRLATKGKIGNLSAVLSGDATGNVWVTNRISINEFKNGFAVPYYQLGRISEQTGELANRTTLYSNSYFSGLNASQRLFYAYNGIYQPKADSLEKIYSLPDNHSISQTLVRPGVVWMLQYNATSGVAQYEIVQFNTITKTTQIYSASNTTQLGKYISYMATDGLGNLWVSQSSTTYPFPPFAKFNGQTWTAVDKSAAMPVSYALNMTNDPLGNIYVIDNSSPRSLYKYDGTVWKKITDMPLYAGLGTMTADNQGNVWFNGAMQVLRYAACDNAPTPTLTATKRTIEIGESVTLQAAGCSDVLWSWTSETETVANKLVRGTNQLVVKPEVNTTYRSRCYAGGCSGADTTLIVTVLPKLTIAKTNKTAYCQGDSLTVGYSIQGKVEATNQYSVIFTSGGQTTTLPAVVRNMGLSVLLPTTLTPGRYVLYLESTQPVVRTRDSVQVTISALPTAQLSSNKPTFSLGDSAQVSIALTGLAPWRFTRWDGQAVQTSNSPYIYVLKATQPTNYSLSVTALSDANCLAGTVKNSLVISALALANEPIAADGISVYPNPANSQLTVEVKTGVAPLAILRLQDGQGKEILQKIPATGRSRREEWNISGLPTGLYILRIETQDGRTASWKLVKQ